MINSGSDFGDVIYPALQVGDKSGLRFVTNIDSEGYLSLYNATNARVSLRILSGPGVYSTL